MSRRPCEPVRGPRDRAPEDMADTMSKRLERLRPLAGIGVPTGWSMVRPRTDARSALLHRGNRRRWIPACAGMTGSVPGAPRRPSRESGKDSPHGADRNATRRPSRESGKDSPHGADRNATHRPSRASGKESPHGADRNATRRPSRESGKDSPHGADRNATHRPSRASGNPRETTSWGIFHTSGDPPAKPVTDAIAGSVPASSAGG